MVNVLIIGKGYIGRNLANFLLGARKYEIIPHIICRKEINYWYYDKLESFIKKNKDEGLIFDYIINCSGFYGSNIKECDTFPVLFNYTNISLPLIIQNICVKYNCKYIHLSSADIYYERRLNFNEEDQNTGWSEKDYSGCVNNELTSSFTKVHDVIDQCFANLPNVYVLRIKNVLSDLYHVKNYLLKVMNLRYSGSTLNNSITFLPDLLNFIFNIIHNEIPAGCYNVVSNGFTSVKSIYEICKKYKDKLAENNIVNMIRDELVYRDDLIIRPLRSYSVLSNKKASMYMKFTTINDELIDRCVKNIIEDKKEQDLFRSVYDEDTEHLKEHERYESPSPEKNQGELQYVFDIDLTG